MAGVLSDHRALYLAIDLSLNERGNGFWKLNTTFLSEMKYTQMINREINLVLESCTQKSRAVTWEILKARIKKASIEYARGRTSESKLVIANLSEKVNEYQSNFPLTKEDDDILAKTKMDLENRMLDRAKSMLFRSKVRWYEEGEINTKYFYSLEKARYNAKTCHKILCERGELTRTEDILEEQRLYYQELYDQDEDVQFNMVNEGAPVVIDKLRVIQESQITHQELADAIKNEQQ